MDVTRILKGEFYPIGTQENKRFPWQDYLRRCILGFIPYPDNETKSCDFISVYWENFTENLEKEEDSLYNVVANIDHSPELIVSRNSLRKKIVKGLSLYYTKEELNRLYYAFCSISSMNSSYPSTDTKVPEDLREFALTVLVVAKKIAADINIPYVPPPTPSQLQEAIQSALRSTMFLTAVMDRDSKVPYEFVQCLDMDSLFRVVQAMGGRTIRIPTEKELNSYVQASRIAAEMLTTGYKREETTEFFNSKSGRLSSSAMIPFGPLVNKIIHHHHVFGSLSSKPAQTMNEMLNSMVTSLNQLLDRIASSIPQNQVLYAYSVLSSTVHNTLRVLGEHATKLKG